MSYVDIFFNSTLKNLISYNTTKNERKKQCKELGGIDQNSSTR